MFGIVCFEFFWGMKGNFFRLSYGLYKIRPFFLGGGGGWKVSYRRSKKVGEIESLNGDQVFGRHDILSNFNSAVALRRNPPQMTKTLQPYGCW